MEDTQSSHQFDHLSHEELKRYATDLTREVERACKAKTLAELADAIGASREVVTAFKLTR